VRVIQLISQTMIGGAEGFGFTLSAELARRGHDVLLLANRANGPLFDRGCPARMSTRALGRRNRMDPRILSFLIGSILRFRPDVLHSHNFEANTWARCIGLLFPRLIVVCHDHSGRKAKQRLHRIWLDRILFRRCAAVFAVSAELGDLLRRRHRVPDGKLHVLPNGIDVHGYTPPAGAPSRPTDGIVCVASLTKVKDHATLLGAFARVSAARSTARLTLVGDGPLRAELQEQVERLGLGDAVIFAGVQTDVRPFLWAASIFVLASEREAMPLSLLEAMASGLASVATEVGEIPEILQNGRCGKLVSPGDRDALAAALLQMIEDTGARHASARASRERVESAYSLKACVDRVEAAYREAEGHR
jgi:glycosyltransferase involved in cell wall biosynthesis